MPDLPPIAGVTALRVFEKVGFQLVDLTEHHWILRNRYQPDRLMTVLHHPRLSKGLLRNLIYESGLTQREFLFLL